LREQIRAQALNELGIQNQINESKKLQNRNSNASDSAKTVVLPQNMNPPGLFSSQDESIGNTNILSQRQLLSLKSTNSKVSNDAYESFSDEKTKRKLSFLISSQPQKMNQTALKSRKKEKAKYQNLHSPICTVKQLDDQSSA